MSVTCSCSDGNHESCAGKVSKWYPEPGDRVIEAGVVASDGCGVYVACTCSCHATRRVDHIESERVRHVPEYAG